MTNFPDQSIFDTLESGDSGIENLLESLICLYLVCNLIFDP